MTSSSNLVTQGGSYTVIFLIGVSFTHVGERGAKSHRGNMSLAQNSIMQMGKFLDNAPVGNPKQ